MRYDDLTDEQVKMLIKLYKEGYKIINIKKRFNVSVNRLYEILADNNVERKKLTPKRPTDLELMTLVDRINRGDSNRDISKDLGINNATISKRLAAYGLYKYVRHDRRRKGQA